MVKTSSQMKNMVEDYLSKANLKFVDPTDKMREKDANLDWQLVFGKTHVTKMKGRDDRLSLVSPINFTKMADVFNKLPKSIKIPLINKINEFTIQKGMTPRWLPKEPTNQDKEPELVGIQILTWIDEEELNRPNLFRKLDDIASTSHIVQSYLIQHLKPDVFQDVATSKEPKGDFFQ